MSRVVTFRSVPPPGERYAEGCFDTQIGREIPWTERLPGDEPGRPLGTARILDAFVDRDGEFAVIVAELTGPPVETITTSLL